MTRSQSVLVVDDDPDARALMSNLLRELGAQPAEAENGVAALAHARHSRPDLILLDVEMPLMDGETTLAHLKKDAELREVPVIVISGVETTEVAVRCIDAGAEDYVTKPFTPTLMEARVRATLERGRLRSLDRRYQEQMERWGLELEERVREKSRELAEAHERLKILDGAKSQFLSLIEHELRTPVTGALGAAELLDFEELDESGRADAVRILRESVERLRRIVEDALMLTRVRVSPRPFEASPVLLEDVLAQALRRVALTDGKSVEMDRSGTTWVLSEPGLLARAFGALLECGLKFSVSGQPLMVRWAEAANTVQLSIEAVGHHLPADVVPRFFDVFSITKPLTPGGDLGLGPPLASQLLRVLGATIQVQGTDQGLRFEVGLPARPRSS